MDYDSDRSGVSEACEDGIDGSGTRVRLGIENLNSEIFLN